MSYFPMCMSLDGKTVLLVGDGPQISAKTEVLKGFGAKICHRDSLTAADLTEEVAFVVIGDTPSAVAARYSDLCIQNRVPVNVVDQPELCTFCVPALIRRGDLTVSISTGGKVPGVGSVLKSRMEGWIPEDLGEILDALTILRRELYAQYPKEIAQQQLKAAIEKALSNK